MVNPEDGLVIKSRRNKNLEIFKVCLNDLVLLERFVPKMKCYYV